MTLDEMMKHVKYITEDEPDYVKVTYAYNGWEEDAKKSLARVKQSREMKGYVTTRIVVELCRRLLVGEIDNSNLEMLVLAMSYVESIK